MRGMKPMRLWVVVWLLAAGTAMAQLKPEEIARDKEWEAFLASAAITAEAQYGGREAVTQPYKLTLEKDGEVHFAVWKNPTGRMGGYMEGWTWEIAAYRLDRLLGLNMVPVTIERRFRENRGSIQIWMDHKMTYKSLLDDKTIQPPRGLPGVIYNRAVYLQRAFDNLVYNEDRHANNTLLTDDWRMILIDHSRSFRTTPTSMKTLLYTESNKARPYSMTALPEAFYKKLGELTAESIREAVGEFLNDKEIAAVLIRRDLILKEMERLIEKNGRVSVIY